MIKLARKVHRIVSYLVFIQVSLWIIGGLAFAAIPFDSVVKGGAVMLPAAKPRFPDNWADLVAQHKGDVWFPKSISSHNSSQGLLLKLEGEFETRWLRMSDGRRARPPQAESIAAYAQQLYAGSGVLVGTRFIDEPQYRYLGLVDELYGRANVWQASFDDSYNTRLYFTGDNGRYLTVRNDFWVFYDAMWRLHIMDYRGGEDFNNLLLLVFAILSTIFTISGLILTYGAAKRGIGRLLN
jgi:hypothetical protein